MLVDAGNNLYDGDLVKLELNYLLLQQENQSVQSTAEKSVADSGTTSQDQTWSDPKMQSQIASSNLMYRVPDSEFKTGAFDTWYHVTNSTDPSPYAYSRITFRFAGTENRLTYIVFLDIPINNSFSSQQFSLQLTVRDNVSVLYNVYDGSLGYLGDNNRIKVNDMTLRHTSNTTNGVFNARYYTGLKTGSNIGNIARAIITWIPYAGTGLQSYEYLTASGDTATNKWFTYPATASAQSTAYNGKIVDEIAAEESGIKAPNDYFLLMTKGNAVSSITWRYSYTAYYS